MTCWSVASGQTAACVRLTLKHLGFSTDVARLLWATQEGHGGRINCPWCLPAKLATVIGVDVFDQDENFISMTRLEEMNYAALTIQRRWRWTRKRIVLRAASEERLQEKLREVRRRLVACLPVGASAKKKTESLKEMKSTLKAVEKEWRISGT